MNKNDLRFKKTEIAIKETYLSLKKSKKDIKIKDLCEKAMINKTTFYAHYETLESLKKQVCSESIKKILANCRNVNGIFTDTNAFVNEICDIFRKNSKTILKLYDNDINAVVNDIEKELLNNYISKDTTTDLEFAIHFCIGGAFRLLALDQSQESINKTIYFIEKIVETLPLSFSLYRSPQV